MIPLAYYVYFLKRPNGVPFYTGYGKGRRMHIHEIMARYGDKSHKSNVIRKIWKEGGKVIKEIVLKFDNPEEAKHYEKCLIRAVGRQDLNEGPLVNKTDGGDGAIGFSEESKRLHRLATSNGMKAIREDCASRARQLHSDPIYHEKVISKLAAYWKNPENRKAQSKRTRSFKKENPERFLTGCAARKLGQAKPEAHEKMSKAKLGKKLTKEHIENLQRGKRNNAVLRKAGLL